MFTLGAETIIITVLLNFMHMYNKSALQMTPVHIKIDLCGQLADIQSCWRWKGMSFSFWLCALISSTLSCCMFLPKWKGKKCFFLFHSKLVDRKIVPAINFIWIMKWKQRLVCKKNHISFQTTKKTCCRFNFWLRLQGFSSRKHECNRSRLFKD